MTNKIYQVFTHKDLDGAVSLLTFLWSKPECSVTYSEISNLQIDEIKKYVKKTCNPPNILIMDLSLRDEMLPELDYEYITFIDHHKRSEEYIKKFKQAKIIYRDTTSNTILVRKLFKDTSPEFTDDQKKLILLADDYDCGENKYPESYNLNILFWTQFKNEFCYFCNYYKNGFRPFTDHQKKIIKNAWENAFRLEKQLNCFSGEIIVEGSVQKIVAATTEQYNNIVIDVLMDKYHPDILFYINTKTEKVSIRQEKSEKSIDLVKFSEKYCDGNGHKYAAGGKITPLFLELTKKLKPL